MCCWGYVIYPHPQLVHRHPSTLCISLTYPLTLCPSSCVHSQRWQQEQAWQMASEHVQKTSLDLWAMEKPQT